ncbi:NupC/NupG family nucleoside CNT transporter [Portibacter marinus]|uniref:NupC/NupG family nucleoside CNT transporter n=1 Tax=Portibacter marinus TaxID=2898660 RepID=UPI001F266D2F|nr:nucleoside transporter C-terminal domain-containing protein [Portibacter marinus]
MEFFSGLLRGLLGIIVLIIVCFLFSSKKKQISWKIVGIGIGLQFLLAILLLKVPFINSAFDWIADMFAKLLQFSSAGAEFIFGDLVTRIDSFGYIFAFQVLPTIVFFSAISAMLYYFGILQKVVYAMAWVMTKTMGLSGPESLAAAANVFIGQTEAPLVVKPYLENMTRSEILCLMTGGMATIAGGVFAAYIGFLGGADPVMQAYFAKHLLTASIISAPAAIVAAKILLPETENKEIEDQMKMEGSSANNVLDAISQGTTDGLKLAVNVGIMLLVFTAIIALANAIMLKFVGSWTGLNDWVYSFTDGRFEGFDFTFILGLLFAPFAWILGTPGEDILLVGQLLGQKTILNEFFAYAELNNIREAGIDLNPKSIIIATYALCGFANFASIGIQIGGISAIAPGQRKNLTELGLKSLIGGTIACFLTAAIAGILT